VNMRVCLVATFWSIFHSQFCYACRLVKLAFSIRIPSVTGEMVQHFVLFVGKIRLHAHLIRLTAVEWPCGSVSG
jgi:hypothetical protein